MPTNQEWAEYRRANEQIRQMVERDIRQVWRAIDVSDRARFRQVILDNIPALVDEYGKVSASLAAEFFETSVGRAPLLAAPVTREAAEASARWAIGPVWEDKPEKALGQLTTSMARHVRQAGRDTVRDSALQTRGVAYARVLRGDENCGFCTVMAGRGAVYTEETARGDAERRSAGGYAKAYHDDCDCDVIAIRDESDWPADYNHLKYESMYYEARKLAGKDPNLGYKTLKGGTPGLPRELRDPNEPLSILQAMRDLYGMH